LALKTTAQGYHVYGHGEHEHNKQKQDTEEDRQRQEKEEKHPPMKMTKNVQGQIRDYYYVKTVKSIDELDKFQFKVIKQFILLIYVKFGTVFLTGGGGKNFLNFCYFLYNKTHFFFKKTHFFYSI
jgi:hypothetical protein